jgi:DNA polymerase III alpha subunit
VRKERFPDHIPQKIIDKHHHELAFIEEMNFANYFLTVHDIVRFARSKNILCQGRGSAANSTVCYCLGITSVDPTKFDLLFERLFLLQEMNRRISMSTLSMSDVKRLYNIYMKNMEGIVQQLLQRLHNNMKKEQ